MPLGLGIESEVKDLHISKANGNTIHCLKCASIAEVSPNDNHSYCKPCFLYMLRHKFRSTLGKNRVFVKGETRCIAQFNMDPASECLLSLLNCGFDGTGQSVHRLKIEPVFVCIISSTDKKETETELESFSKYFHSLENSSFEFLLLHLSSLFCNEINIEPIKSIPKYCDLIENDSWAKFVCLLDSTKSETARIELNSRLKNLLLIKCASKLGINKILKTSTSNKIAENILNSLCLGRGASISHEGSVVLKGTQATFVRPLRDISDREVDIYNALLNKSASANIQMKNTNQSIQGITSSFVCNLQGGFSSTVSTIVSTGEKVKPYVQLANQSQPANHCSLCCTTSQHTPFCKACLILMQEVGETQILMDILLD